MPNLTDFIPIFQETTATIRARLDADVNAGLTPESPAWIDTREGGFYYDVTQPVVIELARLWDALSVEVPAAAFVEFAWGDYLDYHATIFNLVRKVAVQAQGVVLFTGYPGTLIAQGTTVATEASDVAGDTIEYETTASGTTGAQLAPPAALSATPSGAGGTLPAGTYYYRVTALNDFGETVGSTEVSAVVTGSTSSVVLDWADVAGATSYSAYRATAAGGIGVEVYNGAASNTTDAGGIGGAAGPPALNTTAGVRINAIATDAGSAGNVGAGGVSSLESPLSGINQVRNELAMAGGADRETDAALRDRILLEYGGQGAGNINDYRRWALAWPGVGRVYVKPVWNGPGTVQVVIMDADGNALPAQVVTDLQNYLDPVDDQAKGQAPVGVAVTVQTPAVVSIDIVASLVFKPGYNLDGGGGLIATRAQIAQALSAYIDRLDVGEDVVYQHVLAQFFSVPGVYSVSALTINGGGVDIALTDDPPQVAQVGSIGLS